MGVCSQNVIVIFKYFKISKKYVSYMYRRNNLIIHYKLDKFLINILLIPITHHSLLFSVCNCVEGYLQNPFFERKSHTLILFVQEGDFKITREALFAFHDTKCLFIF